MVENKPQFPEAHVQLVGMDGNAFSIMGRVTSAMKRAGASRKDLENYRNDAMSGDYNNLLRTTFKYVTVVDSDDDETDFED